MAIIVGPTLWQFPNAFPLGEPAPDGGNTICKSGGGTIWIVAPECSEVGGNWYCRNDAVTAATNCTSATGWFVPTIDQLQNPGYECRTYWDSNPSSRYWSNTESSSDFALFVCFNNGNVNAFLKSTTFLCTRAFRCVTY